VTGTTHRWRELAVALCIALAITSICSHLMVRWLKIKASWGDYRSYGAPGGKGLTSLLGSSIAFSGVDWQEAAAALGTPIERWGIAGSTPSEWEQMQPRSARASRTIVVVSAVDMNEYTLCDFRAEVVPLAQTITDLWQTGADWSYSKRVLSQYSISAVRVFFPTVGRSDGVLTGVRDRLAGILRSRGSVKVAEARQFDAQDDAAPVERISDWAPGKLQRRMVLTRSACQNRHGFNGLKKAALIRILQRAHEQGQVVVAVMPMSPVYQDEFLTPAVRQEFERTLDELQRLWPQPRWIRLDAIPALHDNRLFDDFVHLNRDGRRIATPAFLDALAVESKRP
jgi:hypothetical protein